MKPRKVIVILGPTAVGKSALGVRLAKQFHGVVISADSRQVYKGMDLGTGKITKKEMRGVLHYLLDVASSKTQYNVAKYVKDVTKVIKKLPATTPIFLVGGTPFYIDALTKPNSFSLVPPDQKLRRRLEKMSLKQLQALLKKKDTVRFKTIDLANRRRLERAVEIASSQIPPGGIPKVPAMNVLKIGLTLPRPELFKRIDQRVDARMKQGMLKEVAKLHRQRVSWKKLESFGLEYRFLAQHLQGKLDRDAALAQLKTASHHFAKRQMTWWKRDQDIVWIKPTANVGPRVKKFLQA